MRPAPRSRAQRKADTIALLRTEVDCWVATADETSWRARSRPCRRAGAARADLRRAAVALNELGWLRPAPKPDDE